MNKKVAHLILKNSCQSDGRGVNLPTDRAFTRRADATDYLGGNV